MQIGSRVNAKIGEVLRFLRKKEGLFQSELAESLNVKQGYVSALERSMGSVEKYKEVIQQMGYTCTVTINFDINKKGENPLMFSVDA